MAEEKSYTADNLPQDAEVYTGQPKDFAPIDPTEVYQVAVLKAELRDNKFYRPDEKDPQKQGNKYQFSFEFVILNEGDFYGRRLWDTTTLAFKPTTKRGATKLYKIATRAMGAGIELDWDQCQDFGRDIQTLWNNIQEQVVGKQLRVSIENTTNPETLKTRSKIIAYNPIKEELPDYVNPNEPPPPTEDEGGEPKGKRIKK